MSSSSINEMANLKAHLVDLHMYRRKSSFFDSNSDSFSLSCLLGPGHHSKAVRKDIIGDLLRSMRLAEVGTLLTSAGTAPSGYSVLRRQQLLAS